MTANRRLLTFELSADAQELEIHLDQAGMEDLFLYLQRLRGGEGSSPRHDHLMTPSWAGNELTEELQGAESTLLNKVTVVFWP